MDTNESLQKHTWQLEIFKMLNDLNGKVAGLEKSLIHFEQNVDEKVNNLNEKIINFQNDFKEFKSYVKNNDVLMDISKMNHRLKDLEIQKDSHKKMYYSVFIAILAGVINLALLIFQTKILQ